MTDPASPKAVPVIYFDPRATSNAYEAHIALVHAEIQNPALRTNEHWRALRDTAFARFRAAFEVMS